jgi:hypothetical protein
MRSTRWMFTGAAALFLCFGLANSRPALAQGHGNGHGHDKDNGNQGDDEGRGKGHSHGHGNWKHYDDGRDDLRGWYQAHYNNLPPGLAKRDQLPPGLQRQLIVNGTLPPGLQKKIVPAPPTLVAFLPPPPPDCEHVIIGGNLVLVNRHSWLVVDIFHF